MADNQFVPENQPSVSEMYLEKSDLVNESESSLYSSSNEPKSQVFQPKNTRTTLFDVNKFAIKDFSTENGDLASSKNAANDLKVPEVGDEISSKNNQCENLIESQYVKPMFKSLLRLDSEENACHAGHVNQDLVKMKVLTKDAELAAEKSSKSEVTATASPTAVISDIESGRRMQDTSSYIQGPFQLSPFGVKIISDEGRGAETIDFATLAEWSGVLHQKNQNPKVKTSLDDNYTAKQQHLRSILRKEQAETVTKPEIKSVHFGFPVGWTKYFTSDEDDESTASTELLFSDEEDEVLETEDQDVPHNENHDEPRAKKARKGDDSFEVPSFSFPEVISIPNLQMLRFSDEEKDHDMTVTNEPAEENNIRVDERERKGKEWHYSSYPDEIHSPDKNNPKELVESFPTPVTCEYVLDKGTAYQLRQADASKDNRQHNETGKPLNLYFLMEQSPSKSHGEHRNPDHEESAEDLSEPSDNKQQYDQLPKELGLLNSDDALDCVRTAEVPCLELDQANEPDYEKAAVVPCCDLVKASRPEYEKSAEVSCHTLLSANSEGHPDYTRTAELRCYYHIQANDPEYGKPAEVPCHELFSANSDDYPDSMNTAELPCYDHIQANDPEYGKSAEVPCNIVLPTKSDSHPDYVKSEEVDKVPNANQLCQHVDTEVQEQLQSLKGLVSFSDDSYLKHQGFSEVLSINVLPNRCDQYCQHNDTRGQEKSQLREMLVDGQINHNPKHGKSDILPCHGMLHVPDALNQTQQNQLKELVPINHYSNSDDREKFTEDTSEKSFSFSPDSNGLAKMQLVQANLSRVTTFTVEGAQKVPETVCNTSSRVNDYLPSGVCSLLLQLGENSLLDEVASKPNPSPANSEKTWMCKQFLEFEDLSLYENVRGVQNGVSKTNEDVTQRLENPSLSPVRISWPKTFFEFDTCDNDHDSCSSQISEIAEEVKNIITMDSSGYEKSRPQSPDRSTVLTNDENQEYRKLPEPNKYRTQSLEALERDACRLDGPELLEMAMYLVETAIRKSKCPSKRLEYRPGSLSAESNKASQAEFKATPAFTWKRLSYESQRATLNLDNQDKNDCDGTKNNNTKLYYNKSCTRPLRVGLSRRNCNHSLHPCAARPRSGNTPGRNHLEASDSNSTK